LLDKYFETNYSSKIYFRATCLQNIFKNIQKPYIDALFWLSCDLTDSSKLKGWQSSNQKAVRIEKLLQTIPLRCIK